MARDRAVSISELEAYNPRVLDFQGPFEALIGKPELTGTWLIWGNTGNGKTRFSLQLAKYMSEFCRVAINSLEEGMSYSMKKAFKEEKMNEAKGQVVLLDKEPISELIKRLKRPKSPQFTIIDSFQYTGLNYSDYRSLKDMFPRKAFAFISHQDGREPAGRTAKSVKYDANVKINIEGFRAHAISRFGGGKPYTIWEEGAHKYWGGSHDNT